MLIQTSASGFIHPAPSEITSQTSYLKRRDTLALLASGVAGSALATFAARDALAVTRPGKLQALASMPSKVAGANTMETLTSYKDASSYNNYYEFGTDKGDPARYAHTLKTAPWSIEVEGLVKKPAKYGLEDIMKWSAMEERIYKFRCVEGWSMVLPWVGYSFSEFCKRVGVEPSAKFVEFYTLADKAQMPGLSGYSLDWPYVEGLRLDEAMHPLTLLTFGMYGEVLPNQNGAPIRINVPWKYGFKNAKSIVKIKFTDKMPLTSWNKAAKQEYGFYSNVNPQVDHPRWSQATERRIGDEGSGSGGASGGFGALFAKRRKTEMFNGYEAQVGQLYAGMDLKKNY